MVVLTAAGLHLLDDRDPDLDNSSTADGGVAQMAAAAAAAFADSPYTNPVGVPAQQRRAGLPEQPVVGLSTPTAAGPVQLVLPAGLGTAQHTSSGVVIYPDAGAGFDFLAENTPTGTRTIARIADAAGPRIVTTFVRTPADTVMLAHTNGFLTVNRAAATAETLGVFSPSETRDAAGELVPSSYVVRQIRPQVYQLSEVIDPGPDTTWPVYVDPPLHVDAGGLAVFGFSDVTDALAGAAGAVGNAAVSAASATASGARAVGGFVQDNPLESAMLVGGTALALTGLGGPAGAAMIAGATVNLASAGLDVAATVMPDNQTLGMAATVLGAASMATPQGAAKKAVTEGIEAAGQLAKHTDTVIDVAKTTPTPPAQLANDVAAAATNLAKPGAGTPKIPNAPPGTEGLPSTGAGKDFTRVQKDRATADALGVDPKIRGAELDRAAAESGTNLYCANCEVRVFRQEGPTRAGDKIPPNRAQIDHHPIPKSHGGTGANASRNNILCEGCNNAKSDLKATRWNGERELAANKSRAKVRTYLREYGQRPDGVIRSPNHRLDTPAQQQRWARYENERAGAVERLAGQSGSAAQRSAGPRGAERNSSTGGDRQSSSNKRSGSKKSKTKRDNKQKKQKSKKDKKKKKKSGSKKKRQRKARG
ncbi:HNH endonuclease [[Mycobacterium] wendilense]|uniref:HNH endonuclease n=1 Tax=[Mycobacterium] wendilense TaxID=3064284 RepID=A0ABN9PCW5_9MYCO|nr:HNH endonuclease [Mycolicibacterium sp. MU0050]CAJ1587601.1 HNH endonuclease [Mycolicibacterium sp. MU0050]